MTPMEAWAEGKPLVIWPIPDIDPTLRFAIAGYSRLPKGDVFFTDTWNDLAFGGHSAHLLDGHAEQHRPGAWRVGRAVIEVLDEEPFAREAAVICAANQKAGADQARFDEMAARLYGDGSGIAG